MEALDPLEARRPELACALTDSAQAARARLLPSMRRAAGAVEEAVDRHRVFSAVGQLLAQGAAERGVVLVIDDLHAADEATVALVHYFEPVTAELSDWMPTHEHFPLSESEGGKVAVDNAILAHRLCNRIDY